MIICNYQVLNGFYDHFFLRKRIIYVMVAIFLTYAAEHSQIRAIYEGDLSPIPPRMQGYFFRCSGFHGWDFDHLRYFLLLAAGEQAKELGFFMDY